MNDVLNQTPGQILKTEREIKQIGLGEVAQRLLLSKSTIIAIEEDDYSKIPAQVYAEGYLKAYSKFLQIPIDVVLESFRRLNVYHRSDRSEVKIETKSHPQVSMIRELPKILKGQCRGYVLLCLMAVLILSMLIVFISRHLAGKNSEIIHVPNNSNNAVIETNNYAVVSNSDDPGIISSEIMVLPDSDKVSNKSTKKKRESISDYEPNLILTKPKG